MGPPPQGYTRIRICPWLSWLKIKHAEKQDKIKRIAMSPLQDRTAIQTRSLRELMLLIMQTAFVMKCLFV